MICVKLEFASFFVDGTEARGTGARPPRCGTEEFRELQVHPAVIAAVQQMAGQRNIAKKGPARSAKRVRTGKRCPAVFADRHEVRAKSPGYVGSPKWHASCDEAQNLLPPRGGNF
jgi:hypothetical protein